MPVNKGHLIMINEQESSYRLMKWLGYAGLLPFYAIILALFLDTPLSVDWLKQALLIYTATIMSFLGAVHWGHAIAHVTLTNNERRRRFLWSVQPSIISWLLVLLPTFIALPAFIILVISVYIVDRFALNLLLIPTYLRLRLHLSLLVTLALALAIAHDYL
jgi:hypothetical protein